MDAEDESIEQKTRDAKLARTRKLISIDGVVIAVICIAFVWYAVKISLVAPIVEGGVVALALIGFYIFTFRRLFALRWPDQFDWKCPDCGSAVSHSALLEEAPACRKCSLLVRIPPPSGKREKVIRRLLWTLLFVIPISLILWWQFYNFFEEQDAKRFLRHLQDRQYQTAYAMFGCTDQHPCQTYAFSKFMEDWGPNGEHPDSSNAKIGLSQSCGDGVLLRIDYPRAEPVTLIVDRKTDLITFAPSDWIECPGKHWHFGRFFKSLFSK